MAGKYTIKDVLDHRSDRVKNLCARFVREPFDDPRYLDRLDEELDIIESKGFVRCFQQVTDIIEYTRSQGIIHVLRGSGACSLMCYLLGITSIDPVAENMVLARFMNSNREDQPDIDIDVPHWVRPQILEHLYQKWPGQVARISNNVKYREKTALRRVLKEHGVKGRIPKYFKVTDYFSDPPRSHRSSPRRRLSWVRTVTGPFTAAVSSSTRTAFRTISFSAAIRSRSPRTTSTKRTSLRSIFSATAG